MSALNNLNNIIEQSENPTKELLVGDILDTSVWVQTDTKDTITKNGSGENISDYTFDKSNKNNFSIMYAITELIKANAVVEKKNTIMYDNVWVVDVSKLTGDYIKFGNFINEKIYILNPKEGNTFTFPELELIEENKSPLESLSKMSGGSNINGELAAIINIAEMTSDDMIGGSSDKAFVNLLNKIENLMSQGNVKLNDRAKDRLDLMLKKLAKYNERLHSLEAHLHYYNNIPEEERTSNNLSENVNKYDSVNRVKYQKTNKDLKNYLMSVITGEKQKAEVIEVVPKFQTKLLASFDFLRLGEDLLLTIFTNVGNEQNSNKLSQIEKIANSTLGTDTDKIKAIKDLYK